VDIRSQDYHIGRQKPAEGVHIHLSEPTIPLNRWMSYWKRLFTQKAERPDWQWQPHHWDTRLRRSENYTEKWYYIRENPVKEGLVKNADDWPYQGMINVLPW
jgi:REP element-mobilizing transposase RayT